MRVMLEVTQPVHGPDGAVVRLPGERLPLDADVEGIPVRIVQVEDDEAPAEAAAPPPAPEPPAARPPKK